MPRLQTHRNPYKEYEQATAEFMDTERLLLLEFEKTLPENHPLRVRRRELMQRIETCPAPPDAQRDPYRCVSERLRSPASVTRP